MFVPKSSPKIAKSFIPFYLPIKRKANPSRFLQKNPGSNFPLTTKLFIVLQLKKYVLNHNDCGIITSFKMQFERFNLVCVPVKISQNNVSYAKFHVYTSISVLYSLIFFAHLPYLVSTR